MSSQRTTTRSGHTLVELIAAMITGSILLAGLASVMFIGREVAYAPTASNHRIHAAQIIGDLADELRWATVILDSSLWAVEFVVADRDYDGAAERFRYAWSGTPGDPLTKTYNGGTPIPAVERVNDFSLTPEMKTTATLNVAGQTLSRECMSRMSISLQTGEHEHSRIEASVPLVNMPERLAAYWRLDFDDDPTAIDVDRDSSLDWQVPNGGNFSIATLSGGIWQATGVLQSRPLSTFTGITTVDVRFRGDNVGLRIPADRQGGRVGPITLWLAAQADSSRTLYMLGETAPNTPVTLREIQDLANDFVRVRLTIVPALDSVVLHVNDAEIGVYVYPTYVNASATDRSVSLAVLGGTAKFDYVDVRVQPTE